MSETPASVEVQLAVINTKLDTILASRDDHEIRVRRLEQFRWILMGVALASGPVTSVLAGRI